MQLNGIAHIQLTVSDLPRSRVFWKPLLELFQFAVEVGTLFLDSRLDFPGGPFGDLGRHLKLSFTHLKFSFTD